MDIFQGVTYLSHKKTAYPKRMMFALWQAFKNALLWGWKRGGDEEEREKEMETFHILVEIVPNYCRG